MPLATGKSKASFSHNVEVEMNAGKPQKQAVAIAYSQKRKAKDKNRVEVELTEAIASGGQELKHQKAALAAMDVDMSTMPRVVVPAKTIALDTAVVMAYDRSMRIKDVDGRLHVADCRISKANICPYLGREIPGAEELGLDLARVYRMYRRAEDLEAAAPTFERIPLMMHHVSSDANNPQKQVIIGAVSNVRWVAPYLVADLTVWDAAGIEAIESERQQELSPGYRYVPVMNAGLLDNQPYDGSMTQIHANHLAIVDTGRTGPDVYVNDRGIVRV